MYTVAVDIGGTFTDVVVIDNERGRTHAGKSLTTVDDLQQGVIDGLSDAARGVGIEVSELLSRTERMIHATTQSSNAVFSFTGARTAVITTRGFADTLTIMRATGRVAGLSVFERHHYRQTQKPRLLVDERDIFDVVERVDAQGRVVCPLDEDSVLDAVRRIRDGGYEAVAVALVFSHKNPAHEQRIREILEREAPLVYVSVSCEVAPVMGEYERSATAMFNAYVGPVIDRYINRLETTLRDIGLKQKLLIVQANGGVTTTAQTIPIFTIESGPAAGVVGAAEVAATLGQRNVIATDVGGTTFKVAVIENGRWGHSNDTVLNQYQLRLPMVDLASIGAGGGSIARVDGRRLRIGPQSASSSPGPACYGLGGAEPTVTDADLGARLHLAGQLPRRAHGAASRAGGGGDQEPRRRSPVRGRRDRRGGRHQAGHRQPDGGPDPQVHAGARIRFAQLRDDGLRRRRPGACRVLWRGGRGRRDHHPVSCHRALRLRCRQSHIRFSLQTSHPLVLPQPPNVVEELFTAMETDGRQKLLDADVPPNRHRFERWVEARYRRQSTTSGFPPRRWSTTPAWRSPPKISSGSTNGCSARAPPCATRASN
ncbi:MAG: hydantoinase/oxoprolinase family protein, partial [Gammaproteobacteria bacterium]|nr:hydantoinase/oxoprolinase family protein [Gammaproteobacteria bacterium]